MVRTESTKLLMRYLAYMGGRAAAAEGTSVEQKVLESNPVLEAFGNAKTVRNNNSSRFGKFVEIQFDEKGRISGAAIRTYLLERSRVCQVSDPERNYHCFYMLCAAPQEDVKKFKLEEPKKYHYLNQSKCLELDSINDAEEYHATRRAMDVVGISMEEQDAIFSVVAAILHLGNVEFAKGAEIDSSIPKDDKSLFHLKTAAELLSCDEKALEDSLCKRIMVPRLHLSLTKTPELINEIETILNGRYTCPHQQTDNSKTSTLLKCPEKLKAMNFPISMIEIGTWTSVAKNPDDIVAKLYFAKKKLIWEFLFGVPGTNMPRLKFKIEIQWNDVLSFEESINSRDETGILKIEFRKPPTFFIETNPQAGKHTQWKQLDRDFTDNQASTCRRHTLHFHPGVLQKNLEKLVTHNSFWSKLYEVPFPVEESLCFDIGFENNNSSSNSHIQTVGFNVNNGLQNHYSPGIGGVGVGDGNFNIARQFRANGGWQRNSYNQPNSLNYKTANELFGMQAIPPPSSQVVNEHYNMRMDFTASQYGSQNMQNIRKIRESQAYALYTQTNMTPSVMNSALVYPPQAGSHLESTLLEEEERQYKELTHVDGNFHFKDYQKIPYINSNDWSSVLPDMDIEEDFNGII